MAASDITLSAGIRQNLLSLQKTADLMGMTQNRLATGKKVNSALDNPSNFFTSQSLSNRASDLNTLVDSIGQAQKTLEATDKGITSLSKLVETAKSIAKQARQASQQSATYGAVNANASIASAANLNGDEIIGSLTGTQSFTPTAISTSFTTTAAETLGTAGGGAVADDAAAAAVTDGTVEISITAHDGVARTFSIDTTGVTTKAGLLAAFNTATDGGSGTLSDYVTATYTGNNFTLTANSSDVDMSIGASSTAGTLTDLGLTTGAHNSTSFLDNIVAAGGAAGNTLNVSVNGGAAQTITFGTGAGQVETMAQFNTALQGLGGGVSAAAATGAGGLTFAMGAGEDNSVGLSVSSTGLRTALGLGAARAAGQAGGLGTGVNDLSRTFSSSPTLSDVDPTNLANGGNLTISVNGSSQTVGLSGTDTLSDVISKLQSNATLNNNLSFVSEAGNLKITAKTADVDFTTTHNNTSAALGLTSGSNVTTNSTSLLDRMSASGVLGSAAQGATLTIQANGGATQTLTFGAGEGQISTKEELSAALSSLSGGVTGSLNGTSLNLQVASGSSATSLTIGGTAATKLGLVTGTVEGTKTLGAESTVRSNLQSDYNTIITQIDTLARDSSYNGVNLLNGDNLKVIFNESSTSTLEIKGVKMDSTGLGLTSAGGSTFQDDSKLDTVISSLEGALTSLRTQASKFGSSLTIVQTRQDFTKEMINTLQTGADALVLADTNEEGANLLALQTRQQLSTTALSMSAQASQAVLRLF